LMNPTQFTPKKHVNLRRFELTLISWLNQSDINLEALNKAQEQLIITQDYLIQTAAPFLVLSHIGFTERYLDRKRQEIVSVTDVIRE
jgi:hypothetical protein